MSPNSLRNVLARCRDAVSKSANTPAPIQAALTLRPTTPPQPAVRPYKPFAEAAAIQGDTKLSKGAQRLWELLHFLGVQVALERKYSHKVSQVVFGLPQSLVASTLGYTDRHVRNLQVELEKAGLLASHALADQVQGRNLWATMLWAVKVGSRATTPRLTPDAFSHTWRNFEDDLRCRNTAHSIISGLRTLEESKRVFVLLQVIVTGLFKLNPRYPSSSPEIRLQGVQETIYRLGALAEGSDAAGVADLASRLAHSLNDQHSFRWWCKQIWQASGSWEAIGALQARLHRTLADLQEFDGIRNPGSWANSRLSKAT